MDKEIDLGTKYPEMSEPMPMKMSESKVMYPHLHICGDKELDLPDSGVMEIEFRKISESERKNDDGSDTYECCLEVRKILEIEGEEEEEEDDNEPQAPARSFTEAEEALDKIAEALGKKKEEAEND